MKWITREHVKVDRVACPWLIKRFVDYDAELLFVPRDRVMRIAERESATPYDVEGVELGHHGQECSFEAIVKKYALTKEFIVYDALYGYCQAMVQQAKTNCTFKE